MADTPSPTTLAKIVGIVAAFAAAWVAKQALTAAWKATTGHAPPAAEDEGDYRFGEVVLAAALTGAVVGVARAVAAHQTAKLTSSSDDGPLKDLTS